MDCSSFRELHASPVSRLKFLHAVACNKPEAPSGELLPDLDQKKFYLALDIS